MLCLVISLRARQPDWYIIVVASLLSACSSPNPLKAYHISLLKKHTLIFIQRSKMGGRYYVTEVEVEVVKSDLVYCIDVFVVYSMLLKILPLFILNEYRYMILRNC